MEIRPLKTFDKRLTCKPDKSVTHRAVMFNAAFSSGGVTVKNPLISEDCLSTVDCMQRLGAQIEVGKDIRITRGCDFKSAELYAGNSGTTMRLMAGLLAGKSGRYALLGDSSLSGRPMKRVIDPLTLMGANITSNDGKAPLEISGSPLRGIEYVMPVKSAQVKSAVLLAGLSASGVTKVIEQTKSRDHTERMLMSMGADITVNGTEVTIAGGRKLCGIDISVCGDISSAAYAMSLAAGLEHGKAVIENVGINETRTGIVDVLRAMGASVEYENTRGDCEPTADITVRGRVYKPVTVGGELIPRLIDELPVIAVLMALCEGESVIKDAAELKVKETDRIQTTADALKNMGVEVEPTDDGMRIFGKGYIDGGGAAIDSAGDHRIAMAMSVALALSRRGGTVHGEQCCAISYPDFFDIFTNP